MVIPVTQNLVQYLIEKNISRVLADIELGEKQLKAGEMTHLVTVVSPEPPEPGLGQ
jgi:hypothetical protein